MKGKAILSSLLIGLALPSYAWANVSLPTSFSRQNSETFSELGAVEIAQRDVSLQQVSQALYNSKLQILGLASQYSGSDARWDDISVDTLNSQLLRLNIHGKIMIRRKPHIRIGLYLQSNGRGNFRVVNYDWDTGRRCRAICQGKVRGKLSNLPSEYPRFNNVLRNIIS